jgi:hypothetical protein
MLLLDNISNLTMLRHGQYCDLDDVATWTMRLWHSCYLYNTILDTVAAWTMFLLDNVATWKMSLLEMLLLDNFTTKQRRYQDIVATRQCCYLALLIPENVVTRPCCYYLDIVATWAMLLPGHCHWCFLNNAVTRQCCNLNFVFNRQRCYLDNVATWVMSLPG